MTPAWDDTIVSAFDVSMVKADIICIEIRDSKIIKGNLVSYSGVSQGTLYSDVSQTNPRDGTTQTGKVVGPNNSYVRFYDRAPAHTLVRATVDTVSNWSGSSLGGRTITNVYRLSKPRDSYPGVSQNNGVTMSHWIYLQLSSALAAGSYTLVNSAFPTVSFTFDDKVMRACSVHATQVGHRAADGSKRAYLSHWIPGYGTEGVVDLSALTTFSIIDANGTAVFTGTTAGGQITKTLSASDTETSRASRPVYMPSTTIAPLVITAFTKATPGVFTYSGSSFVPANGDFIKLRGMSGATELENAMIVVASVNTVAKTFAAGSGSIINGNTTTSTVGFGTLTTGTYAAGFENLAYKAVQRNNRSCTDVYALDYSAWTSGAAGSYRVYVPGVGVSYPFSIGESVHYLMAKNSMKGYYNQLWGTALSSSVGGVDRPANAQGTIKLSKFPAYMSTEVRPGGTGTFTPDNGANASTWFASAPTLVSPWKGWSDAGDWDMHIVRHYGAVHGLYEFGYDRLPSGVRNSYTFGFPKMTTLLDATTYAGTDSMGDAVHMATYYIDALRLNQDANGWVPSGLAYNRSDGGGDQWEPSFLTATAAYAHAGDHLSNFCYALNAAKAATVFYLGGFTTLGDMWLASAERAWDAADAVYLDYHTNGIAGTTFLARYGSGGLNIKANAGWTDAQLTALFDLMQTDCGQFNTAAGGVRMAAAGALYRATGTKDAAVPGSHSNKFTKYGNLLYPYYTVNIGAGNEAIGAMEYIRSVDLPNQTNATPATGSAQITGYQNSISNTANNYYPLAGATSGYRFLEVNEFMRTGDPSYLLWAFAYSTQNQSNAYLKLLHDEGDFHTGANQENLCLTSGIGSYYSEAGLIRDREAMGLTAAQWPGLTQYTWWWDNFGGNGFAVFGNGDAVNYTVNRPFVATDPRLIEPYYQSVPPAQSHWACTFNIDSTEFTTQSDIVPTFLTALTRWAWDGNLATSDSILAPTNVSGFSVIHDRGRRHTRMIGY